MKKLIKNIAIILFIVIVSNSFSLYSFAASSTNYHCGLQEENWDSINYDEDDSAGGTSSLPSAIDNSSLFPSPGNQGIQNSCVGWAVAYAAKSGLERNKRNWSISSSVHHFSPSFIYNQINGKKNVPVPLSSGIDKVASQGVCTLSYFAYNENDWTTPPSTLQKKNAALYKGKKAKKVTGINKMKARISEGYGIITGIITSPDLRNLNSTNPIYNVLGSNLNNEEYHAICLIGYDDSKNAFKFINSWGTDWGINGYGWISYDLISNYSCNIYHSARGFILTEKDDSYIIGDVSQDKKVTSKDARLVLRYVAHLETLSEDQLVLADVNGDAKVNSTDANALQKYVAHIISQLPIYD
ncbi:MAG: hypothetical protein IJL26_05555 [Clostridia bacterium]|nr:hypothetical protein [Clostridia bacterium]